MTRNNLEGILSIAQGKKISWHEINASNVYLSKLPRILPKLPWILSKLPRVFYQSYRGYLEKAFLDHLLATAGTMSVSFYIRFLVVYHLTQSPCLYYAFFVITSMDVWPQRPHCNVELFTIIWNDVEFSFETISVILRKFIKFVNEQKYDGHISFIMMSG